MEKYDLSRLNSTSFERLIRAVCFELFGPSGTVYGSGPDGARDFTVEGKIRGYEGKSWDGYLILQAKFRERLQGGDQDVKWLKAQLDGENAKFKTRGSKIRRPDYYIIATNVVLSGTDGAGRNGTTRQGGMTKTQTALKSWQKNIGLLDFDIWSNDKIVDLLAGLPKVRQSYAAWITVGDVLTSALAQLNLETPVFESTIRRGIKDSIRRDQHARLKDAGSVVDAQIRVSQVFIDLPTNADSVVFLEEEFHSITPRADHIEPPRLIAALASRAREKLDPESVALYRQAFSKTQLPARNKIVVLGGPGQGKSTASMFLAQLFRASLIESCPLLPHDDNIKALVPEILQRASREGVTLPLPRRYPVFVSLPRFADAITKARLNEQPLPSILSYLALELSMQCDQRIARENLRTWLQAYPWIAVLDGLDEVPPSGEREEVLEAISSFSSEIVELCADVLLIVTTRPQGYNHDLSQANWEHWNLLDLTPERAIAYAEALGAARYPSDLYRREDIQHSIIDATSKAATSRLMISPLQVTIMYLIVDTGGSVPAARWSLFNEYFDVLRKREKAKGGPSQKVLERNSTHLAPIHQRAGLVLQTESEYVGGAVSYLDRDRFQNMVGEYLRSQEFENDDILKRSEELMNVALHRLVLLSSRQEEQIAFDVRSLQEFMAAAAITSGRDPDVENRLNHLAGLTHWRHVFLIAASRFFSEDAFHHLRAMITSIPRSLDSIFPDAYVKTGAHLSLEMFVDGIGIEHPKSRRILAQHALELLSFGPEILDEALLHIVDEHTIDIVIIGLKDKIAELTTPAALAAWKLLCGLARRYGAGFVGAVLDSIPSNPEHILNFISVLREPLNTDEMVKRVHAAMLASPPNVVFDVCEDFFASIRETTDWTHYCDHSILLELDFTDIEEGKGSLMAGILGDSDKSPFRFRLYTIRNERIANGFTQISNINAGWLIFSGASHFCSSPSIKSLTSYLTLIKLHNLLPLARQMARYLPWPIAYILDLAADTSELNVLIEKICRGEFGDTLDWYSAEQRWIERGISKDDFITSSKEIGIINHSTGGLPKIYGYQISHQQPQTVHIVMTLYQLAIDLEGTNQEVLVLKFIDFASLGLDRSESHFGIDVSKDILHRMKNSSINVSANFISLLSKEIWNYVEFVKIISDLSITSTFYAGNKVNINLIDIINAYNKSPENRGLLILIAAYLSQARRDEFSILNQLDKTAFGYETSEPLSIKRSASLLSLARGDRPPASVTAELFVPSEEVGVSAMSLNLLFKYFGNDEFLRNSRLEYLVEFSKLGRKMAGFEPKIRELLLKVLNTRRSTLTSYDMWINQLGLPKDAYNILQSRS